MTESKHPENADHNYADSGNFLDTMDLVVFPQHLETAIP